jgi:hypothetical protein
VAHRPETNNLVKAAELSDQYTVLRKSQKQFMTTQDSQVLTTMTHSHSPQKKKHWNGNKDRFGRDFKKPVNSPTKVQTRDSYSPTLRKECEFTE